ncbi:MAG: hypothetical protein AAF597_11695, partial [Bacteroidota bacterium]
YAREEINSEYEVNTEVVNLATLADLGPTETLIFSWRFRTSEHNNLEDKLEGMQLFTAAQHNGYQRIRIAGDFEGFDHYDIYGKTFEFATNQEDEEDFQSAPLVNIADPFTSQFHTDLSKPLLGGFATEYNDNYSGEPTGVYSSSEVSFEMPDLSGMNLPQTQGMNMPSNQGGGSTTTNEIVEIDLEWPWSPFMNTPLFYRWYLSSISSQEGPLNEHIESQYLKENSSAGFASSSANNWIYFKYYVTEKVLSDAEEMTDFYEYWRDRILRPEDHVEDVYSSAEPVLIRQPDQRRENLEDLEAQYLTLVNSALVRNPPVTILTLEDYEEEDDPPPSNSGSSSNDWSMAVSNGSRNTILVSNNYTVGGSMSLFGTPSSSGQDQFSAVSGGPMLVSGNDDGLTYVRAAETQRDRLNLSRYGFSNQLRFRAFFPDTGSNGQFSSRTIPLNN